MKELLELDADSRKDSIFNKLIKCVRFNQVHFYENREERVGGAGRLLFVVNGVPMGSIPEYRDSLLSLIKAEDITLLVDYENLHGHGCRARPLAIILFSTWGKDASREPLIDNIEGLTIVNHKRIFNQRRNAKDKIKIKLECFNPQKFTFRIEDFSNREKVKTRRIRVGKGTRTIEISVNKRKAKVISIIDSENNLITIIN